MKLQSPPLSKHSFRLSTFCFKASDLSHVLKCSFKHVLSAMCHFPDEVNLHLLFGDGVKVGKNFISIFGKIAELFHETA